MAKPLGPHEMAHKTKRLVREFFVFPLKSDDPRHLRSKPFKKAKEFSSKRLAYWKSHPLEANAVWKGLLHRNQLQFWGANIACRYDMSSGSKRLTPIWMVGNINVAQCGPVISWAIAMPETTVTHACLETGFEPLWFQHIAHWIPDMPCSFNSGNLSARLIPTSPWMLFASRCKWSRTHIVQFFRRLHSCRNYFQQEYLIPKKELITPAPCVRGYKYLRFFSWKMNLAFLLERGSTCGWTANFQWFHCYSSQQLPIPEVHRS